MSLHLRPTTLSQEEQSKLLDEDQLQQTELRVKCLESSAAGGLTSRCAVDPSVLCAPRHRTMLAAFAMLPDPLPQHLQIGTLGTGPTSIASFVFKFFAQHLKRLDVVTEPAVIEHPGLLDFGLSARTGPIFLHPVDGERFLQRTDKKYDILFISSTNPITGHRGAPLTGSFTQLVRKSLSSVGVAAFELKSHDYRSQQVIKDSFGAGNVFFVPVPKSSGDLVALAGYQLPVGGVWKRHLLHRSEDISYAFRLPYDVGAHLPLSWFLW